ncbi:hypothetical protein GQ55_2G051100 [Panicum hallii var. hallii]|uniref:Uncharacterized protein n=1 Tax=Panicum hallii var. hallii TaxID=1504633 RepID=A0A2T7ELM2_9POAL|nr:hypothetical protein GQ55_2G051100 [Panicum hallii var. hallii]
MRQVVAAVAILLLVLGSGAATSAAAGRLPPVESRGGSTGRQGSVVQSERTTSAVAESSAQPSGCTNGSGPGGYCHPPSRH